MSDQYNDQSKYIELRNIHKYYIDIYIALYQLKTEKEEELNEIYKMIKTNLIDSKKRLPENIIKDIMRIILYNNRYTKSYLALVKHICDDYHITEVPNIPQIDEYLFYKEYGIKLGKSKDFNELNIGNPNILQENTINAIMNDDIEKLIILAGMDKFNGGQILQSKFYPYIYGLFSQQGFSLLELCCYYGAVNCFKFLRTKFHLHITYACLQFSFLGGNQEIMSECLKRLKPYEGCMEYAIISHNIDFVTFLMNEHKIKIKLSYCGQYRNFESFLVYLDQIKDIKKCFIKSAVLNIPSFCKYFLSHGAKINAKDEDGWIALYFAAGNNSKETAEFLISQGADIDVKI